MKVIFHGATRTVTGSLHEVQAAGKRVLLDCGFYQGPRAEARRINSTFDFPAAEVDAVVLSHGHTDHCGNLPNLVKQGFRGPIYCTRATAAVTALMLLDSAKIQEEDAAYLNQKTVKSWQGKIEPLYTLEDAQQTIERFEPIEYRRPRDIGGIEVELRDAGHVLGSAAVALREKSNGPAGRRLVFSGDVGRPKAPILEDPDPFKDADVLISECTYGGRRHEAIEQVPAQLQRVIKETVDKGGWVLIPSFALGRTQALIHQIHQLRDDRQLPRWLPIYIDSPLANRLTEVFRQFKNLWDDETQEMLTPFDFPNLSYVRSVDESRALNQRPGPGVIIASSGMCESGRILHHLKHHLRDGRNTVLLPGFQAAGTLGRKIQDRWREVPILGDVIPLHARVETIDGLSAHADGKELVDFAAPLRARHPRIYLVHGEIESAEAHRRALLTAGFADVTIASRGDVAEV